MTKLHTHFIFDVDGTLTPSRDKIDEKVKNTFNIATYFNNIENSFSSRTKINTILSNAKNSLANGGYLLITCLDGERIFNKLKKDPFLQGVILRVNSPGGSIIASDQILYAIEEFKKITNKPVYASMGNVAASGGYYIAVAADSIFANKGSILGSIGVIISYPIMKDLFDKVGIAHDDIEALATYYEVTCDYYEAEFLGLEDYI